MPNKWDVRFIELAKLVASWSKDPSTKCGAIIVRPDRTVASLGYNGFPRAIMDNPGLYVDREAKYMRIVHCEMNAILSAREPLHGYTLYLHPLLPCQRCAVHVIQAGISRVVATPCPESHRDRWELALEDSKLLFMEAGVICDECNYA